MGAVFSALKRVLMTLAMVGGGAGAAVTFNPDVLHTFPQFAKVAGQIGLYSGILFGAFKGAKEFFKAK